MKTISLVYYVFDEALSQPLFKAFFLISGVLFLFLAFTPNLPYIKEIIDISYLFFLLYSVVGGAGLIVEKIQREVVELFSSKPFSRKELVFGNYLGVSLVMAFFAVILFVGIWIIYGIRQDSWDNSLILQWIPFTLGFLVLYAFITLTAVVLRNLPLIVFLWSIYIMFGAVALELRSMIIYPKLHSPVIRFLIDALYCMLPQILAIKKTFGNIWTGDFFPSWELLLSILSAICALICAMMWFERKELT